MYTIVEIVYAKFYCFQIWEHRCENSWIITVTWENVSALRIIFLENLQTLKVVNSRLHLIIIFLFVCVEKCINIHLITHLSYETVEKTAI